MRFAQLWIEAERLFAGGQRFGADRWLLVLRYEQPLQHVHFGLGEARMWLREARIERDRAFEHLPGQLHVRQPQRAEVLPAAQVHFVCLRVGGA